MAKITMGMTTWTEHPVLIHNEQRPVTLNEYAQHFPTVEVDTFFYALPQMSTIQNWLAAAGQLKTVLFQFPPYFDASVADIEYLKLVRTWMGQLPVAVELRNSSWYQPGVVDSLISYCRDLKFTLVAADEPHDTVTSVPFKLVTTNPDLALLRLHGRNKEGWANQDKSWRKTRTLYRYSEKELAAFAQAIRALNPAPKETCVIFNNNSAKDAAPNALQLQKMMGVHFSGLAPRSPEQLDLF